MTWYKIEARETHAANYSRTGENMTQTIYLWADDEEHALRRYRLIGGVKKTHEPNSIRDLSGGEAVRLQRSIINMGFQVERAKQKYIRYDSRGSEKPPV